MAPPPLPLRHYAPSHVTEDTPPDLLEGTMELEVTLPNGKSVVMTVHRSTPMMDLLIQVTTAHRINPGGHVIQVVSDNIFLSYKPSTPIGTLDTNAIKIVAKNTLNEKAKARKNNLQQQAIERNIRLKVNLPRNQLAVYRVPPKSLIADIFDMVCRDKSLDPELHEIRHPVNVDERLRGSCSLSDYQLHEVCIVSSDFRPPPLSVTDLITMSSIAHPEDKKRRGFLGLFARKAKSSTGDSSVSSGSAGERSVSPARSDESIEGRPHIPHGSQGLTPASSSATITGSVNNSVSSITATAGGSSNQRHSADDNSVSTPSSARLSRPVSTISLNKNKKRQAPIPPQRVKRTTEAHTQNGKINGTTEKRSLSRHSSDSSGYHEPEIRSSHTSPSNSEVSSFEATRNFLPPTNLMSVPSVSSLSVASSKGGKRKAPSPPKIHTKGGPSAIPESPEEMDNTQTKVNNEEQSKMTNSQPPKTNSSVRESVASNVKDGDSENKTLVVPTKDQEQLKVNGFSSHSYSDGSKSAENMKEELNVNDQSTVSNSSTLSSNSDHKETSVNLENIVKEKDSGDPSLPDTIPVEDIHNEAHILEPPVDPVDTPLDSSSVNHIKSTVEPNSSQPPGPGATDCSNSAKATTISGPSSTKFKAPETSSTAETTTTTHPLKTSSSPTPFETQATYPQPPQPRNDPKSTLSMFASPKPAESAKIGSQLTMHMNLKSTFPDRLDTRETPESHLRHIFPNKEIKSDALTNDSKVNTLPKSAKNKILKIIPKFGTISHSQTQNYIKGTSSKPNNFSSELHTKVISNSTRNSVNNDLDLDIDMFEQRSNPKTGNSENEFRNHEQVLRVPENYKGARQREIVVKSIFNDYPKTKDKSINEIPVPLPRKSKSNSLENDLINVDVEDNAKINVAPSKQSDSLSNYPKNVSTESKDLKSTNEIPLPPNSGNQLSPVYAEGSDATFSRQSSPPPSVDYNDSLSHSSSESQNLSKDPNKLSGLKSWRTSCDLNSLENDFGVIDSSLTSLASTEDGQKQVRSIPSRYDLRNSFRSDAENEDETRTVSLSSETSNTSVEMLNPKDIQRPKRHRRKKIPEAFMNVSENVSDSSNSPKSMESLERVEDLAPMIGSNPSQTISNSEEDSQNVSVEENSSDHVVTNDKESLNENDVEFLKEVPEEEQITPETKEPEASKLAVVYVEDVNIEESSTDPVSPSQERKPIYTSKVQLASVGNTETKSQAVSYENSSIDRRSVSVTQIISKTPTTNSSNPETWKDDVIAELKSAIGSSSDEKTDCQQPRILNCKPKEFNCGKPSDYNLILSFKKTGSSTDTPIPRSDSTSSYDSADTGSLPVETDSLKKSRSSTETSYESAPPPPPDTLPPLPSDSESKASSSVVSRQSSFGEQDVNGGNFVKPPTPAFSISTYQSRASKISYDKKLSRSESLASFNDFHTTDGGESKEVDDGRKVWRSDSQRNEVFKSDELKKKSTSTTFLNLAVATASSEWSDKVNNESNIRPSLLKSQSKTSLVDSDSRENSLKRRKEGNLKFEVQSAKEADSTINKPLWKSYSNLRKAKSSLDVRGNEGRMQDPSLQGIPDSGLASEYMRLQDDFMKWQQQLLQNQQLLHTRVAPIAANPPTLNNVGIVTNLNHSNTPAASQPRKPVEITIPIRFEDSDEEKDINETTPAVKQNQRLSEKPSNVSQTSPGTTGTRWVSPNVMVEPWQERPPGGLRFQSNVGEPQTQARSFVGPQRMQTVFQSVPSGKQGPPSQTGFQQVPQPTFDQAPPQSSYQNVPQPGFQQRQSSQQMPQSNFQQMPQSNFQQMPQSSFQQMPQSNFQQMPQSSFQQMPQSNFKQMPQTSFQQVPQSNFQQTNPPTFQQTKPNIVPSPRPEFETEFNQAQNPEPKRQNQFGPRVFSQQGGQNIMQQPTSSVGIGDKPDDNINARFSSVVTLSNDDNDSLPKKDKVRSIVQLNNSEAVQGPPSVPSFPSKVIGGKLKSPEADDPGNSPASASNGSASSAAPVSSRLVQQATQQQQQHQQGNSVPRGGFRVSPPKFDQPTSSTPKFESRYSPPKTQLYSSPTKVERFSPSKEERSSPQRHEPSPPFANVKLRPVESSRVSPPKVASIPQAPAAPPPPPPPPNSGPPPPPPPPMSEEDRRTATGKKIFAAANVPQLDAREELMMAIRQFGGSGNLRKSGRAPPR